MDDTVPTMMALSPQIEITRPIKKRKRAMCMKTGMARMILDIFQRSTAPSADW